MKTTSQDVLRFMGLNENSVLSKIFIAMKRRDFPTMKPERSQEGAEPTTDFEKACLEIHHSADKLIKSIKENPGNILSAVNDGEGSDMQDALKDAEDEFNISHSYLFDSVFSRFPELYDVFGINEAFEIVFEPDICPNCQAAQEELLIQNRTEADADDLSDTIPDKEDLKKKTFM